MQSHDSYFRKVSVNSLIEASFGRITVYVHLESPVVLGSGASCNVMSASVLLALYFVKHISVVS